MALNSISPVDGRYRKYSEALAPYFSESASMRYKIIMEGEYLIALSELGSTGLRAFSAEEKQAIRELYELSDADAQMIRDIEVSGYKDIKATNHDFKAIEYFIKDRLGSTGLADVLEWVHFGLTSEDPGNIAHALAITEAVRDVYLPALVDVTEKIEALADAHGEVPLLARTHGQPASPSTFGKEFRVFSERLRRQIEQITKHHVLAKLNGATGNYNALAVAYPDIDWIDFSRSFIQRLSDGRGVPLMVNLHTTQIEPHDSYVELFDMVRRANMILIDFDQDVWRYVSDGWLVQKPVEGEVGSSTMPHKINPWFLENSEGNLGMANALFEFFARKLPVSRLQRDISDSTVQRNIGVAFSHALIGIKYLTNQLARVSVDAAAAAQSLDEHPEVITEAIQTVLRREGIPMPYEKLKELSRGKKVSLDDLRAFIGELPISTEIKESLLKLTPQNYIGMADTLARETGQRREGA